MLMEKQYEMSKRAKNKYRKNLTENAEKTNIP